LLSCKTLRRSHGNIYAIKSKLPQQKNNNHTLEYEMLARGLQTLMRCMPDVHVLRPQSCHWSYGRSHRHEKRLDKEFCMKVMLLFSSLPHLAV
jgi:hypothetical protein